MKTILIFLMAGVVALSLQNARAQTATAGATGITVHSGELRQCGDSLRLRLQFTIRGKAVRSHQSAGFTPILVSDTHTKTLPVVAIKGRRSYKAYRRSLALMNRRQRTDYALQAPYRVVEGYKPGDRRVTYALTIPFEEWMAAASLKLEQNDCGCGRLGSSSVAILASHIELEPAAVIEPYEIIPAFAYVQPEAEVVKRRSEKGEARLDFAVGKTAIDPVFGRNPQELEKIRAMIELVRQDRGVDLRGITITGYASPEGSLALNGRLSEGRADALKRYLQSNYPYIPEEIYRVRFGGENWGDLAKALEEADIPGKSEALEIIAGVDAANGREQKLMTLHGGAPWRRMLRELFPALRKVTVLVDYEVENFDPEEAREVVKTRPQNLSLNEMYTVAQTYDKGSPEFNDLFEIAVRMFPEDTAANINAAVAALERRDYMSADRYLKRVNTKIRIPEYENAMGVLAMMRDADYEKAEIYFRSAEQAGIAAAATNLDQIANVRENAGRIEATEHK